METSIPGRLVGWDIHGFLTMEDLDLPSTMTEASSRWLRPNEIHAMLSNYSYFTINVKPVNLPKGGTIVLFDRKKLRNFRKDGHNWKKKKDGKTIKEAHERLKVGTEERIHVYYAHGEDNPTFVRRCYWLLDKDLEHIVLVHYRETQELQGSPATPVNSDLTSDSKAKPAVKERTEAGESINFTDHVMKLHEINTLEWDDLLASNGPNVANLQEDPKFIQQYDQQTVYSLENNESSFLNSHLQTDVLTSGSSMDPLAGTISAPVNHLGATYDPLIGGQMYMKVDGASYDMGTAGSVDNMVQRQDSLARWINEIVADSPESMDEPSYEASVASSHGSYGPAHKEGSVLKPIFSVTDISSQWASSTEETKILVVGFFLQEYQHMGNSKIFCICGDTCVPAEFIQAGALRCLVGPHRPGLVKFYLSFDRSTPISQVLTLEFRSPSFTKSSVREGRPQWDMFQLQTRLARLLFSTSKSLDILSNKVSSNALKEGKKFAVKYSNIADSWAYFTTLIENGKISFEQAKDSLFELTMKSRLKEWLLERIVDESKISERDAHGQGVLHLCAILDYTWAVYPFSCSGLSLDFRDKFGWTAIHWAAYYGREKMVAALLSAGARPNLVTDPNPRKPGGFTAADLASNQGYEGLAAYLAEKALVQQFEDMKIAGNADGTLDIPCIETPNSRNISEDEICLKDTLTAYRTAADAAARIQTAFRVRSLKQRTKDVESSNPEDEARCIVAAMRIQHAFRNYETRKKMVAAVRIQYRFRTWKIRKDFVNMRRRTVKIQAAFRGYLVRRQYKKICWSVGVLEKALLRWRLKRKGLRGLQIQVQEPVADDDQGIESNAEEGFYQASRKQAEERVDGAVRRIQGMFRSRQAQQDYRRMKLAHRQAELEFEECANYHKHSDGL